MLVRLFRIACLAVLLAGCADDAILAPDDFSLSGGRDTAPATDGTPPADLARADAAVPRDLASPGCDRNLCPTGCCDGNGACQINSVAACGTQARACMACPKHTVACIDGRCI